jgi:acyl-CoA synthetase (AMP-forming)/AMP-acid ligase II/acyl carrier protein
MNQDIETGFLATPLAELALSNGWINDHLRCLLIGGDQLRHFPYSLPSTTKLINNYGPTETTVVATSGQIVPKATTISIGRPIANTRIYLLDGQGEPVPLGAVGEIYIGGAGVARGYLNRPELTAELFLPDPFSPHPEARMYRSGDLARYLPDGNLLFLGRRDQQLKIRGFRIEPGEIEAHLRAHPAVREALVIAREDHSGEKRLVAYYLTAEGVAVDASDLRAHLSTRLPEYMIPAAFVMLDSWPLMPNGKLDRNGLPVPELHAYAVHEYEAPEGEIEIALAQIWSKLLKVDRIGRHDNFFELGGHSLLAMSIVAHARDAFNVELPMTAMFQSPTVEALACQISDMKWN